MGKCPIWSIKLLPCENNCKPRGYHPDEWLEEMGSGLHYQRKHFNHLMEMIEMEQVRRLVVAQKDRLVRFGCEWFAASVSAMERSCWSSTETRSPLSKSWCRTCSPLSMGFVPDCTGYGRTRKWFAMLLCTTTRLQVSEADTA